MALLSARTLRSVLPALILSSLIHGEAQAQKRTQTPVLPDAARPGEELQTEAEKKEKERRPLKAKEFYLGAEGNAKYEQLAAQKRDEAIEKLKQIIDSGNIEGDQKAEMLLRLAELYYEKSKYLYLQEMRTYDEAYSKWFDDTRPESEKGAEPQPDLTKSRELVREAVNTYRQILRDHPKYARTDEVLFFLAFNLMDLGESKEGLEKYQTLVKSYPNSPRVPDAYVAIGEYYFEANQAFKALNNYKKATSYPDTIVYGFAMYKLGWCYYNVGEFDDAIAALKIVVDEAEKATDGSKLNLKDDALKDLVLFYSEKGDMDGAYAYFSKFGDKKYYKASLTRLADTYFEQGKFDDAVSTYRKLLREDPLATDAPSIQGRIIQCFFKQNKKTQTLAEIDVLVASYGPSSDWAKANSAKPEAVKDADKLIQGQLIAVAVDYHKEARKTKSRKTYELAHDSYRKYLDLYPKAADAYDTRFAYAEVKYDLGRFEEAADEYARVIEMDSKGKHIENSSTSLILSINEVLKTNKGELPKDKLTPTPLNDWEKRKVDACKLFVKLMPTNTDAPLVLYEAARLYYDHNQYDDAMPLFLDLIATYSTHPNAEISANLVLDAYNARQDWENLDKVARTFYANPAISKGEFQKELKDIYEKASFKKVQTFESAELAKITPTDGQPPRLGKETAAQVSDRYMAFYKEFPTSGVADVALNNAAVYAYQSGAVQRSIDLREEVLAKFPNSKLKISNLEALGRNYESIASYKRAAEYYERLVSEDKDKSYTGTPDALYNAALFRESLGEWEKAAALYEQYSTSYPDREDSLQALVQVARLQNEHQKYKVAADLYKRILADKRLPAQGVDVELEMRLRLGRVYLADKNPTEALKVFQVGVDTYNNAVKSGAKMVAAPLYVAEMKFNLVQPLADKYRGVKIELPEKLLGERLVEKLKLLKEVENAYAEVLQLGQAEWGIAALHEIGMAYKHMAEAILTSPIPPRLKGQQVAIYTAGLEDKAYPLMDKAAEAMEQALAKSYELSVYNKYTASAAALLAELRPREYPPLAERVGSANHMAQSSYSSEFIDRR